MLPGPMSSRATILTSSRGRRCMLLYCNGSVLYCVVLCYIVLYCVTLCYNVLYCVVLCCIVLYCVILCYTVLYCGILNILPAYQLICVTRYVLTTCRSLSVSFVFLTGNGQVGSRFMCEYSLH